LSASRPRELPDKDDDYLETLYDLREELKIIANSEAEWAKYAEEGLSKLREAGYDV